MDDLISFDTAVWETSQIRLYGCKNIRANLMESEEYLPLQVFNYDETGLFREKIKNTTYTAREEKEMPGHKPMKDSNTLTQVVLSESSHD